MPKIALVDDDRNILTSVSLTLEAEGYTVATYTAGSGTEALKALADHPVDVIFTDISMPGLDGLALAKVLARFADRPQVVFVTAYDEHAVTAFELEVTDYVMKPVRADRLGEAVRRVVAQRAEGPGHRRPAHPGGRVAQGRRAPGPAAEGAGPGRGRAPGRRAQLRALPGAGQ